jgi:Nucleotide-diphospho-sugar transferase
MKIISMTNMGQIDMMKNMLNSAEKVGIPLNLFTVYLMNDIPQASDFWTMNFYNITYRKLKLIYDTLVQLPEGERLFWVDNDIYFFKNPLEELQSFEEDFIMQDDIFTGCTGFWTIKRSEKTCNLIKNSLLFMHKNKHPQIHDQNSVWETMKRTNHGCSLRLLDRFNYPVGDIYFNPEKHGYKDRSQAKILHNNFLNSSAEKVERFKANNMWNPSDEASSKLTIIRLKYLEVN